jgi:hypothetical protein
MRRLSHRRDAMSELPVPLLGHACRVFLGYAYPGGPETVPVSKRSFLHITADQPLGPLLRAPLCQTLGRPSEAARGYAWRLGSATYPHLKLQAVDCSGDGTWVFAVDTHDTLRLRPDDPDAAGWAEIRASNQQLKQEIERAWEADGLLTFNALLRRDAEKRLSSAAARPCTQVDPAQGRR